MNPAVLAIDNDQLVLYSLKSLLQDEGIEINTTTSGIQGIALFREVPRQYSIVLLDYEMKTNGVGMNGDEIARQIKAIRPDVRIIMISGRETPEIVRACSEAGAEQFIVKGTDTYRLVNTVRSMLLSEECDDNESDPERREKIASVLKMVGRSRELARVAELVSRFSVFEEPVLISGETGVGKEGVAHAVHENSMRRLKPFLAVNCSAFSKDLLESELFGHERGSFTGAINKKLGLLEQAAGGTVFLDEIGDMPLQLQAKILRTLQEKVIQPVGGTPRKVDFRVVAATHKNLKKAAQQGEFRQDLYYRLNYLKIEIPPLRERPEDIEPLVRHFLFQMKEQTGIEKGIADGAMRKLKGHDWPGNVRDLEGMVKTAFALADTKITPDVLRDEITPNAITQLENIRSTSDLMPYSEFEHLVQDAERTLLSRALELAGGVKSIAAGILGISHNTMNYRRLILGLDKQSTKQQKQLVR